MATIALDIIIPVYNEGDNIRPVLEALGQQVKTRFRVMVCYDHEEDTTLTALQGYAGPCEVVPVRNSGKGPHSAVLTGFRHSNAPAVLVFPADDTFNAGIIDRMFQRFEEGCDVVAASRFMKGGCMEGCPWLKALLVRVSAFTLYYVARIPVHDPTSGFRLFSSRCVDLIEIESTSGFTYSIELLLKCHRLGWKTGEVPAAWYERKAGKSRFRVLRWLPAYLRWYFYAFGTTWLRRRPETVPMVPQAKDPRVELL